VVNARAKSKLLKGTTTGTTPHFRIFQVGKGILDRELDCKWIQGGLLLLEGH